MRVENAKYITIFGVAEDTSATVLRQWLDAGFRECAWHYMDEPWQDNAKWMEMGGVCPTCNALDGQHFKIAEMLEGLAHNAPKYEKAHVGCKCLIKRVPREEEMLDYPEETVI
jgi:hypothetical protein